MTRRLITFLGTTDYKPLTYAEPGGNARVTTPFVARAQTELLECDEVVVMATDAAWDKNGTKLTEALASIGLEPTRCPIPDGRDEAELRQQFRALTDALGHPSGAVVLDITHGFRAQPFFAATALAVLAAAGKLPEDIRITYGAMEATDENDITPIWDLSPFMLMQEIALGVAILGRTGHGGPLIAALERERRQLARRKIRGERENFSHTETLQKAIRNFCADLATLRLPALTIGGGKQTSSASRLLEAVEEYRTECARDHPALLPLLDDLAGMARPLPTDTLFGDEGKRVLVALARLYLRLGRPLEATAVAREGYVGLFADSPAATDAGRNIFDDTARQAAERRAMATHTGCAIADIRNDLLHGAMRKHPRPASALDDNAKKAVKDFAAASPAGPEPAEPTAHAYFVTRHPGAVEWAWRRGIAAEQTTHLDPDIIEPGDIVLGTLPVHIAARVCKCGGRYFHLSLDVPPEARGRELSADDMERFSARLDEFTIRRNP